MQDAEIESSTVAGKLLALESSHASVLEEKERARALADVREEALSAERSRVQQLEFQLRSTEQRTDGEKQRATVRTEEVSRLRVRTLCRVIAKCRSIVSLSPRHKVKELWAIRKTMSGCST